MQTVLLTFYDLKLQGGKAKLSGSKICWFWANEWIYGSKFKPHMSTQPIYIDSNQKDVFLST